ncbi:MAG: recombination mediator RecR [Thermodesulfobacteriota bacterium]
MRYAGPIERLIKGFSGLPGIGEKSATRLALFVLNSKKGYAEELAAGILDVRENLTLCSGCMAFSDTDPCEICRDSERNAGTICVVSDFKDMMALEAAGDYRGRYHVLHGNLSPLKSIGPEDLRIKELLHRVRDDAVREVVLATGFDSEGEATSTYLARLLKPSGVKVTRLASGVPMGSYIEFMDRATLGRAMAGRREVS